MFLCAFKFQSIALRRGLKFKMVRCLSVQSPIEKSKIILTEAGARVSEFQISHILANIE